MVWMANIIPLDPMESRRNIFCYTEESPSWSSINGKNSRQRHEINWDIPKSALPEITLPPLEALTSFGKFQQLAPSPFCTYKKLQDEDQDRKIGEGQPCNQKIAMEIWDLSSSDENTFSLL